MSFQDLYGRLWGFPTADQINARALEEARQALALHELTLERAKFECALLRSRISRLQRLMNRKEK